MRSKDPQSRNEIVKFVPIIHKVNIHSQICSKDQQCKYKIVKCLLKIRKMINKIRYIYIYISLIYSKKLLHTY